MLANKPTTLASARSLKPQDRIESPERAVEYLDALDTIELSFWMAYLYGEPVNRNIRRCCKRIIMRYTDWKVRAIVDGILRAPKPAEMLFKLVDDLQRHLSDNEMTREDIKETGGSL